MKISSTKEGFLAGLLGRIILNVVPLFYASFIYKSVCFSVYQFIKGVVCNSNSVHFVSNSENISSWAASCPFCVCTEKKSGVHTQSWLCKWKINRVTQTEPPARSHSQVIKYRCFVPLLLVHRTTLMLCITGASLSGGSCVFIGNIHLSICPVNGSFIIGVTKSINIHCLIYLFIYLTFMQLISLRHGVSFSRETWSGQLQQYDTSYRQTGHSIQRQK